ncbi:MAG TPA: cytochrome c biogenesis protein CcdA [Methanolinea sp.]|nr:cytochrome c biogenesis protein CcdA [Methanolinea sp.]HQK55902.1 cytochrome c biogenesis protein CcdA [Methanolinea sp.]
MAFLAGLYAPLGSPCVIPLYPGFLSFLAGTGASSERKYSMLMLGMVVAAGVIISMLAFGIVYVTFVQVSLSRFLSIISPAAFLVLAVFSLVLILDIDFSRWTGVISIPRSGRPILDAFLLGLFFGIVILPCNAAAVVALLAIGTTATGFLANLGSFFAFGIGMSLPLLALAALSLTRSREILAWFSRNRRAVHVVAGVMMLGVSLYYLLFVFFPLGEETGECLTGGFP